MKLRSLLKWFGFSAIVFAFMNMSWSPVAARISAVACSAMTDAVTILDDDDDDDDADSPSITVEGFREPLEPYGRWIETIRYGQVWHPEEMPDDWRPYSYGHWECSEMGWMFVSEHPWGWACYHYGRWLNTPDNGWIWVPGTVWAPAWVAWRAGGEHIGWAPLPPDPHYHHASTVIVEERSFHLDFVFVSGPRFCEPVRPAIFLPAAHQVNIINQTTNITQVKVVNKTVINNGPQITQVNKFVNKPVTVVKVKDVQKTEIENFHKDVTKIAPEKAQRIASTTEAVEKNTNVRVDKVQQRSPEVQQRAAMAVKRDSNDDDRDLKRKTPGSLNRDSHDQPNRGLPTSKSKSSEPNPQEGKRDLTKKAGFPTSDSTQIPPPVNRSGTHKPDDRSDKDPFLRTAQGQPKGLGDRPPTKMSKQEVPKSATKEGTKEGTKDGKEKKKNKKIPDEPPPPQ